MFNELYSCALSLTLRAKKSCQNLQTGIHIAFHSGSTPHCRLKTFNSPETDPMKNLCIRFYNDEAGFVVSTELTLVCTVTVLSLCVGLSEVSHGVNQELEDIGCAFGSMNQSFCMQGFTNNKGCHMSGHCFTDHVDMCDSHNDIQSTQPTGEHGSNNHHNNY